MEWLGTLRGRVVGVDTSPIIYFIEEHPAYLETLRPFFLAMEKNELQGVTSIVTLLEALVHPLRLNNVEMAQRYRDILLDSGGLTIFPVGRDIAEEAAALKAFHNLRTPDAIQLGTAIRSGASAFLTNDSRLPSLPDLRVIVLEDLILE